MANGNNANIGFEKQIWDAACVLWGHIPAAEYRKVIVGLIFLRYISSAFEKRYQELVLCCCRPSGNRKAGLYSDTGQICGY